MTAEAPDTSARIPLLELDYEQTLATWRMLVDVRFKLLALVPTITGVSIALLAPRPGYASSLIAAVALAALFGIVMYDLRNSAFHDATVHRAKQLERPNMLNLPRLSDKGTDDGGLLNERPRERYRLFGVKVWHDRALYLVYSSAVAGWVGLLVLGLVYPTNQSSLAYGIAGVASIAAFAITLYELHRYDKAVLQPKPPVDA